MHRVDWGLIQREKRVDNSKTSHALFMTVHGVIIPMVAACTVEGRLSKWEHARLHPPLTAQLLTTFLTLRHPMAGFAATIPNPSHAESAREQVYQHTRRVAGGFQLVNRVWSRPM